MKKYLIVLSFFFLSLFLGGCFEGKSQENQKTLPLQSGQEAENTSGEHKETQNTDASDIVQKQYSSLSECTDLKSTESDRCYAEVSKVTKNDSSCTKIVDKNMENVCYLDVASVKSSGDSCSKIQETSIRDACYMMITSNTKTFELCKKIQDTKMKDACLQNEENTKKANALKK